MFEHIKGTVCDLQSDRAVIETNGIGYEIICSTQTIRCMKIGETHKLFTYLHIAFSQDVVALYGFETAEERAMFKRLIGVTRVGPKLALGVLGVLSPQDIAIAILTENVAAFDKIPGMGKKTAARVLLELKEKVTTDDASSTAIGQSASMGANTMDMRSEAIAALVSLGYDGVTAGRAVAATEDCAKVEDMITGALRQIAGKGKK